MTDEQRLGGVLAQRRPRREEPQSRVDAGAAPDGEQRHRPDRLGDDQRVACGPVERDLVPGRDVEHAEGLKRRARQLGGQPVVRDTEPSRERGAVTVVAVEQLDDRCGLAELAGRVKRAGVVPRVDQPDPAAVVGERVGAARRSAALDPGEAEPVGLNLDTGHRDQGSTRCRRGMFARVEPPVGTIALLFTDVEGSTRLASELGAAWPELLAEHHRILSGAIAAEGGYVDGTEGDAFFATFADPAAAGRAAIAIQRALAGHRINVRIGLHVGHVERAETGYVGLEVHRAARVAAAAHGGQLILTGAARELAGVDTEPLGSHRLKDFPAPETLFCAVIDGRGAAAFPPPRADEARPTNLPAGLPTLLGRESELAELVQLVTRDGERLITVTGRGGSGKTSLALVAADRLLGDHAGGVWLVQLAGIDAADGVLPAIAAAIGADRDVAGERLDEITTRLKSRGATVLLLDNLEHLVPAVAGDLAALLDRVPELRILATSQVPIRLDAERVLGLDPLDDDAALELIVRVAGRRSRLGALGDADRAALLDVVRLLDGLPLALELAAARLALLRPAQLRDRLTASLDLLKEDRADRPARQRSLRATVEWTLGLLDDPAVRLFERLGVFAGPAELEMLEAVLGDDVLDPLAELLDVGLVRRVETGDGRIRLGLPEALRQIAAARLDAATDADAVRRAHAEQVARILWVARAVSATRPQWDAALEAVPEAKAAQRWASVHDRPLAARIATSRAAILADLGHLRESVELLEPLRAEPPEDPIVRGWVAATFARSFLSFAKRNEAEPLLGEALATDGDPVLRITATGLMSLASLFVGDWEPALRWQVEASRLAREHGDPAQLAGELMMEAQARLGAGELDAVEPLLAESERIGLPVESYFLERRMTIYADLAMVRGQYPEALERYALSLEYAQSARNELQVIFDLRGVANTLATVGSDEAAIELTVACERLIAEAGGGASEAIHHLFGDAPIDAARERLGPERAAAAEARGAAVLPARRVERACELARAAAFAQTG